jgi:ABC-2 type transport system permease protein
MVLDPTTKSETTYFKEKTMEGISPATISSTLSSQSLIIPLVVMIVVMMSGGMIIASMGMEKENKTLETLMTMPVKRRDIVFGKLGGAAVVGLIMAVVYMLGMNQYMDSMQSVSTIDLAKYGLVLDATDYVLVGVSLFLAVLGALTLCMLLGAMARDYKSAQSLTLPVSLLAMVPLFILMMKDFATLPTAIQGALFLIPFTHPMMAMNNLMFDDYTLVLAGIGYELVFVIVTIAIAVWIFKKDMLVSGRQKRNKGAGGKKVWPGAKLGIKKGESTERKEGTPLWKDLGK